MEEFFELEFKYRGDQVKLNDFIKLMETLGYSSRKDVSSWDRYYIHKDNKEEFIRFRDSDSPELTLKRKVKKTNSWARTEVDLPLDKNRINTAIVDKWAELEGYEFNFTIFKTCVIFWQDYINCVYYTVSDENMKETGRFLEIEFNKDKLKYLGQERAFEEIKKMEKELAILGITPQNRLKKNLFELFAKST